MRSTVMHEVDANMDPSLQDALARADHYASVLVDSEVGVRCSSGEPA